MQRFGIVRHRDGWTIIAAGRRWGRFDYKVDAEEAALRLAQQASETGSPVEVLAQNAWGEMTPMPVP